MIMYPAEKTCKCIKDLEFNDCIFLEGREYQVDVFTYFFKIYQNGGYDKYIFIEGEHSFNENFKIII